MQHYFANDYLTIDPVATHGMATLRSFDWNELPKKTRKIKQVFDESIEFGLGHQGLSIPIVSISGERAVFNINAECSDKEWNSRKPLFIRDLSVIAQVCHLSFAAKETGQNSSVRHCLTERELESLKWAASGKSAWETSVILSVSERTVRFHLDQARRKLNCSTKIQAVAKSVATGLINIS